MPLTLLSDSKKSSNWPFSQTLASSAVWLGSIGQPTSLINATKASWTSSCIAAQAGGTLSFTASALRHRASRKILSPQCLRESRVYHSQLGFTDFPSSTNSTHFRSHCPNSCQQSSFPQNSDSTGCVDRMKAMSRFEVRKRLSTGSLLKKVR